MYACHLHVGIDTRQLTQKIRETGTMLGRICYHSDEVYNNDPSIKGFLDPNERHLVSEVSIQASYPSCVAGVSLC